MTALSPIRALLVAAFAATPVLANGNGDRVADPLDPLPAAEFDFARARHLLMRAGFGGTPEEVERLHRMGLDGMVDWLVDYEARPDVVGPLRIEPGERIDRRVLRELDEQARRRLIQQRRREDQQKFQQVRAWWMRRMLETRRPLEERMTLFWHGHFTSSYRDVRNSRQMLEQNELLRREALGNFGVLLHDISKDPAMLEYLDNNRNRRGRPNENFAREVMELFALGIGNYSEEDIREAARALTGWTFAARSTRFVFNRRQHDSGTKTIFGKTGNLDGDDVCDLLLAHPACAPHIAGKVFAYFAYDDVADELRAKLGGLLRSSRYELKPLLRRIFKSRAFYSAKAMGAKVKSPIVLAVSTVRMLGMNPPPAMVVLGSAARLGQELMAPPNVKGWEGGASWITTASLLDRNNVCGALLRPPRARGNARRGAAARGGAARARERFRRMFERWDSGFSAVALAEQVGAKNAEELVDRLVERLLVVPLGAGARESLVRFVHRGGGESGLDFERGFSSPEDEGKLRELLHLIMSTPEFQVS